MNAIYLHPKDGFTFLENVPEKPITKGWMSAGECGCYVDTKCDCMDYAKALNEAIEKRMVIGNPEVFAYKYEAGKYTKWCRVEDAHSAKSVIPWLKEGELYPWPGTWEKIKNYYDKNKGTCGITMCYTNDHKIKDKCLGWCKEVVILSPPKEEKKPKVFTTFPPEDSEEKENESTKFSTLNSGFSIESKVCEKCGSVLKTEFHKGLRIQKVEPVNSSIKLDPIRTVDEMQEVVNEGNSSMSEKEESEDTFSLQKAADNMRKLASLIPPKSEPVVSQDQLWKEILDYCEGHYINDVRVKEYLQSHFNISRKPID